jgi:hypothetical protein
MKSRLLFASPGIKPAPLETNAALLKEHDVPPVPRALDRQPEPQHLDLFERIMERFELLEHGMGALAEQLASAIPSYTCEYAYSPSATALVSSSTNVDGVAVGGFPTLGPQTDDLIYVLSALVSVPSGATGLLQLGNVTIPVTNGTTMLAPLRVPLFPQDLRALTVTTAGPLAVVLMGQVAPTRGKLPL